jgi:UDP-N-acetylglucosamine 4-epimerase
MQDLLAGQSSRWLVTGAAGFIGSHLLEALLRAGQQVTALDNFSTGYRRNLEQVQDAVTSEQWKKLRFIEGDIRDPTVCANACLGAQYVLHQAALGSVPRSLADPLATHESNATGFLNMLVAARDAKVTRFVYAASSSTYGDHPDLPKQEDAIGAPLSPYAVTKYLNELYASVFARCYGLRSRGLRYFNVFGPRQDPHGAYAAVIPLWIASMIRGEEVFINGDGETSRDFCFVDNAVQANLRAAITDEGAEHEVYNVAVGERTSLNELFEHLRSNLSGRFPHLQGATPTYRDFRAGDVRHSQASIARARSALGYEPTHRIGDGLSEAMDWYIADLALRKTRK